MIGILCTGLLSAFIGLVAYFGQYMGTFVISLDDAAVELGISISDNQDFLNPSTRLLVNPVNNAIPVTFSDIAFEEAISKDGDLDTTGENNFIAYTFYLRNEGNVSVDVALDLATITVTKGVDSAVRVAIIEDGYIDENGYISMVDGKLYMKSEENMDQVTYELLSKEQKELYDRFDVHKFDTEHFGDYVIENFNPGNHKKFTLLIWLEGWDADCNDSIKNGQLKMDLSFKIVGMSEED